jgi:hypothetical protein
LTTGYELKYDSNPPGNYARPFSVSSLILQGEPSEF